MTPAEASLLLFTACNTLRVLAYVPQLVRIARDTNRAEAISYTTWGLFAVSHLSTMTYAITNLGDVMVALAFGGNAVACFAILGLTWSKRRRIWARKSLTPGALVLDPLGTGQR